MFLGKLRQQGKATVRTPVIHIENFKGLGRGGKNSVQPRLQFRQGRFLVVDRQHDRELRSRVLGASEPGRRQRSAKSQRIVGIFGWDHLMHSSDCLPHLGCEG